jgi:16S rRNA (adenine1518-N6/adenine1519-N6)-dimethyltransferase
VPGRSRIPIAKEAAAKAGFWTKKHLGQHLLRDSSVVEAGLAALKPEEGSTLLEIGPGLGALTEALLKLDLPVIGVEVDAKACEALKERFGDLERFHLIQADILDLDLKAVLKERGIERLHIAANLPYYITTPVIAKLLEEEVPFSRMIALTQWEVAQRLAAGEGSKDYAAISVLVQFWCRLQLLRKVPPGAFTPPPRVDSGLLLFEREPEPRVAVKDRELFFKVVRSSFGKRRKTLKNALKMSGDARLAGKDLDAAFAKAKIDPVRRPETLSLSEFAALTDSIGELLCAE